MKRKLLYVSPLIEELEVELEGSCLQNASEITPTIDDMEWDEN